MGGCTNPVSAKMLCKKHYERVRRTGSVDGKGQGEAPLAERLLRRVEVDPVSGCWLWTGAKDSNGYGRIQTAIGTQLVHRVAFMLWVGDLGDDPVDHGCHDPLVCTVWADCPHHACVNPDHLVRSSAAHNGSAERSRVSAVSKSRTPEQRAAIARKMWETRRARYSAQEIAEQTRKGGRVASPAKAEAAARRERAKRQRRLLDGA